MQLETPVHKAIEVHKVYKVLRGLQEILVPKEIQDHKVLRGLKVQ